jgi:hypothetical protein
MRRLNLAQMGVATLGVLALTAGSVGAGTDTETLDNGASLTATIDTPSTGDTYLIPPPDTDIDIPVAGAGSIGEGAPNVHWTYVIDVSGSTAGPCSSANILQCEKDAVLNLNNQVVADGSALDVGVTVFGTSGARADMSPDAGDQDLSAPDSPNVATVVNSAVIGGINQFTARSVGQTTNFTAGLLAALGSVQASSAASKNVVFLSDGISIDGGGGFNAAVASMVAAGATIYSFAVGAGSSCTGGSDGTLQAMSDATGGTCTNVPDPADLPDIVQNVTDTEMTGMSLTVDANPTAFDTLTQTPPFDGPGSSDFTATAAGQTPGTHEVCFTATGTGPRSDPASEASATQCETYDVYGFSLTPATATNELGSDDTHTVTATLAGPAGSLEGYPVDFSVSAGPNAGEAGVCEPGACTTDADGVVTFTYTVPVEPASLGTDTISATVTVAGAVNGDTATVDVEKTWEDTTPPTAQCQPSVNPGGRNQPQAPGNGGQGQNQDGFYVITADDDVWPDGSLKLFVVDDGSGTVFGPYASGTVIKYTEANGATPGAKSIGGPNSSVHVHITGNGDAVVTAVDGSGNESDGVSCLVPPAPQ